MTREELNKFYEEVKNEIELFQGWSFEDAWDLNTEIGGLNICFSIETRKIVGVVFQFFVHSEMPYYISKGRSTDFFRLSDLKENLERISHHKRNAFIDAMYLEY